ncbi:hypothetical protein [Phenylobacterium sp.]|jgi:hypothetical protein|uniref:hypothetical protein n=1 Tax=Phenylobacterium sp. TaxID=1871053 RepID=UPI0037C71F0A
MQIKDQTVVDAAAGAAMPDAGPEPFELEVDGEVHTLPGSLRGAFMMNADYTRKTQELADLRRALDAEREAFTAGSAAERTLSRDRMRLALIEDDLEAYDGVDWNAWAAQDREGAEAAWARRTDLVEAHAVLSDAAGRSEAQEQLSRARETAEAMARTGQALRQEIEGWSPETAAKLVDYARAFGVTMEELAEAADPRLWKLLHKAWKADQTADEAAAARARELRPAVSVAGAGGGAGGLRDELAAKEWMRRRNAQTMSGR